MPPHPQGTRPPWFTVLSKPTPKAHPRLFCHCVPQFLFLQNRDKAPPPARGAMSHSIPRGTRDVAARCRQQPSRALAQSQLPAVSLSNQENVPTTLGLGGQRGQSQDALTAQIPDHCLHLQAQEEGQGPSQGC